MNFMHFFHTKKQTGHEVMKHRVPLVFSLCYLVYNDYTFEKLYCKGVLKKYVRFLFDFNKNIINTAIYVGENIYMYRFQANVSLQVVFTA